MIAVQSTPDAAAETLRKQVMRLLKATGDETRGNILVLPQVFLEFLGYDHKMAIFLNQLLYWTERSQHPQKWVYKTYQDWYQELGFKESVIRRLLYGDPTTKTHKRTLTEIGIEVKVKRAPNGSPTCHYRINMEMFLAAIRRFGEAKQPGFSQSEAVDSQDWTERNPQDGKPGFPDSDATEAAGSFDQATTAEIPSEVTSTESSCSTTREDDLQPFFSYQKRFGELKAIHHSAFRAELTRLGTTKVREVLERCATRGRSWSYVAKALANEAATTPSTTVYEIHNGNFPTLDRTDEAEYTHAPQDAVLPVSDRLQTPWQNGWKADSTVADAWSAALHQLETQLDSVSFQTYLRDAVLVDYVATTKCFLVVVRTVYARDMLQGRLYRTIRRILVDIYQQSAEVQFVLRDEWTGQGEQIA